MSDPVRSFERTEGTRMLLKRQYGPLVYSQGMVCAEYSSDGRYQFFIVGDELVSFIGSTRSLDDCKEEIRRLEAFVESEDFQREVAKYY